MAFGTDLCLETLTNSWICFTERLLLHTGLYLMSAAYW